MYRHQLSLEAGCDLSYFACVSVESLMHLTTSSQTSLCPEYLSGYCHLSASSAPCLLGRACCVVCSCVVHSSIHQSEQDCPGLQICVSLSRSASCSVPAVPSDHALLFHNPVAVMLGLQGQNAPLTVLAWCFQDLVLTGMTGHE